MFVQRVLGKIRNDEEFLDHFLSLMGGSGFDAFFFETPAVTADTLDTDLVRV